MSINYKTMNDIYGDGSDHKCCPVCSYCVDFCAMMLPLNSRNQRKDYQEKRKKQLEVIAKLSGEEPEDDIQLYYEMKKLRVRANELL